MILGIMFFLRRVRLPTGQIFYLLLGTIYTNSILRGLI